MKIELSNGVVVIPTPEIATRVKQIIFEEIDNCPAWPEGEANDREIIAQKKPKIIKLPGQKSNRVKTNPPEIKKPIFGEVKRYTPEEKEKIMRMWRAGDRIEDIAEAVGRKAPAVRVYIYGLIMKGELEKRSKARKSMFKAEGDSGMDDPGEDL